MKTLKEKNTRQSEVKDVKLENLNTRFNKEHYVSIVPTSKFYYSFRNLGYNNYEALADIIDNCLDPDVDAKNVWVEISKNMDVITISDNGSGMSLTELNDALQPGSEGRVITNHDLGLFGCGLKSASLSMGKRFRIITKKDGDNYYIADFDLERFDEEGSPVVPVSICSKMEIEYFNSKTQNTKTGTVIIIDKLDRIKNKQLHQFTNILGNHLSEIYRYIISDTEEVTISINGKKLEPSDTMLISSGESELFNKDVPNQIYDFKFKDNGRDVDLKLKIKIYYVKNKSKEVSKTNGRNMRNQGFYVLRNNRQIIRASSLDGVFTRHPSLNGFRAELFFGNEYDEFFDVSLQKKEIVLPQGLSDKIQSLVDPILKSIKATDTLEDRRREESVNDEDLKNTVDRIKKNINDKGSKIRPEGVMSEKDKRDKVEKDKKEKDTKKDDEPKRHYPQGTTKKSLNIFDYGFEAQGEKGDICRFINQGNGVISVKVNIDHIFYQEVFLPSNDDVKNNLMSLLFSLGRAQEEILRDMTETTKIDTREIFDDKLERMSRIFSKIIKD
jgi:hypothetical protein